MFAKRAILIAIISLFLLGTVIAQPGPKPQPNYPFLPIFRGLNLSEDQQSKIEDLHLAMQKKMITLRGELQKLQSDFRLMVIDDKVSEGQLEKQLRKIHELKLKMDLERAKTKRKVRALLTDVQKKKFDSMYLAGPKAKKFMHKGKGRPMGHFPPPQRPQ